MPPAAAFLTGEQVTIRAELGLLTEPEADERAAAQAEMDGWLAMLAREGLLGTPAGGAAVTPEEVHGRPVRLPGADVGHADRRVAGRGGGRTPAAEPAGDGERVPELANPAADGAGAPVLLEDLPAHDGVRAVVEAVRGGSRGGLAGGADRVHA